MHSGHPESVYASRLINNQQITQLLQKHQNTEALTMDINNLLKELSIQELLQEIESFKEFLDSESVELLEKFIEIKKQSLKDKENKELRKIAWELKDKLKEKGIEREKMDKIIRCCKKLVELEQQLEEENMLQDQIEIPPKN